MKVKGEVPLIPLCSCVDEYCLYGLWEKQTDFYSEMQIIDGN